MSTAVEPERDPTFSRHQVDFHSRNAIIRRISSCNNCDSSFQRSALALHVIHSWRTFSFTSCSEGSLDPPAEGAFQIQEPVQRPSPTPSSSCSFPGPRFSLSGSSLYSSFQEPIGSKERSAARARL